MKSHYQKINQQNLSLGELVSIVSSCARNEKETAAALADLFESGRVVVRTPAGKRRVRLSEPAAI